MNRHRVWAEIDLWALGHNLGVIRRRAGSHVRILLVVKADAYGHGAVPIARHALSCGVEAFGVSSSAEALELRSAGLAAPILILGIPIEEELVDCLHNDIHVGVHSSDRRASLERLASAHGLVAKVHLNVDTGMGQLGVPPELALGLLAEIHASPSLELAGIMTHVASPRGLLDGSARLQEARFARLIAEADERGMRRGWVHIANSATLFSSTATRSEPNVFDTVRPGIAAYGILDGELDPQEELEPVLSLRSQVVYLRDVQPGTPVGYGGTWRAEQPTRIATLAVGYDDGVPWRIGGLGEVLVRGRHAPIIGRVSMDYTSIDVGHIPDVQVGDVATLVGRDGPESIRLREVAGQAKTIPYELTCSIGRRVARVIKGPVSDSASTMSHHPKRSGLDAPTGTAAWRTTESPRPSGLSGAP